MTNLSEKFTDPNSRNVLHSLECEIAEAGRHPLLLNLKNNKTTLMQFMCLSKARLDAATNFVPFLSVIQEKAQGTEGWEEVASALRENLNEELGFVRGEYHEEMSHDQWRHYFRHGLLMICQTHFQKLPPFENIDVDGVIERINRDYGEKLRKICKKKSVPYLAGAFTVLEGILEQEFSAMHAYIRANLTELTSLQALYVSHHAGHEHKHFNEAAEPLLRKCAASPHIVPEVIEGIERMMQLRLEGVLGNIEMRLQLVQ